MTTLEQTDLDRHPYMCEHCLDAVPLTKRQYKKAVDHRGRFLCETCLEKRLARPRKPPRRRRVNGDPHWAKVAGCIVSWRDPEGEDHVVYERGHVITALLRVTDGMPEGSVVLSICTPRSIHRDMTQMPRRYGGHKKAIQASVDAYSHERNLLSEIDRLDLLPDEAYPFGRPA